MGRYAELQKAWEENREDFRRLKEEIEKNEDAFRKIDECCKRHWINAAYGRN